MSAMPATNMTRQKAPTNASPEGEAAAPTPGAGAVQADRLVIRTKSMTLEVKDARKALTAVQELAKRFSGYVTDSSISSDGSLILPYAETAPDQQSRTRTPSSGAPGPYTARVTVKVPAKNFESLIVEARKLGDVEAELEQEEDVTQQHIDLKARLKNLRAEEERLIKFFDAARSVKDMLAIEKELGRVRGEVESLTAQISYLDRQAAMASLTLTMHEPERVALPAGAQGWGVVRAFTQAIRNFVDVVNFLIMLTGAVLPLLLLMLAVWLLVRWYLRRRARLKKAA